MRARAALPLAAVLLLSAAPSRAQVDCADLHHKAAMLREGADNCDSAVASGQMSSCQVHVSFSLTDVPAVASMVPVGDSWLTSPASARDIAAKLDAIRCVQSLELSVNPPGPLQPGDTFTITANVTMSDGSSPEGLPLVIAAKDQGLIAFNDRADNGSGDTRIARKASHPKGQLPALPPGSNRAIAGSDGIARFHGVYSPTTIALPGDGEELDIDIDKEALRDLILGGILTAAIVVELVEQGKKKDCSLKPGENILDRFIDGTRLGEGFLDKHEGVDGAHTKEKHVSKSLDYLRSRLTLESRTKSASTFYDQPTAEKVIRAAVKDDPGNYALITDWLSKNAPAGLPLSYTGSPSNPVGFGISRANPQRRELHDALTVLRVQRKSCKIFVLTAYPQ